MLGDFTQAAGISTPNGLIRLLAGSNQPDAVFQTNTAALNTGEVDQIFSLPNDQMLLFSRNSNALLTLGGVNQRALLRLNADGTPDASFNMGTGPSPGLNAVAVQPDGKMLLAGAFSQFNGQAVNRIIRLNANGSLDTSFQSSITGQNVYISKILLQADGSIVVAGNLPASQGPATGAIVRLLSTGAPDISFNAPALVSGLYVAGLAVQPDAKTLVAFGLDAGTGAGAQPLMRLLPNGSADASFQTGTNFNAWFYGPTLATQPVVVEPGGNILVGTNATAYNGQAVGRVVRLLPSGSLDTGFQNMGLNGVLFPYAPTSIQLLTSGQLLTSFALLNSDGTINSSYDPRLRNIGYVSTLLRQADGKLLVGGNFSEISGQAAGGLARLNADGTPDVAFTTAAVTDGIVYDLGIQSDGKILVGGEFTRLGGSARQSLGRLLPSGQADAAFSPTIQPYRAPGFRPIVRALALQADGNVLLSGRFFFQPVSGTPLMPSSARVLGSTGQLDSAFPNLANFNINRFLVQPDGKIVVAGQGSVGTQPFTLVQRVLPDGTPDPAFTTTLSTVALESVRDLQLDAAGRIYAAGNFAQFGNVPTHTVVRLLPNGPPDPSFITALGSQSNVYALALQPNGRLLVGGAVLTTTTQSYGSARLLADGSTDASYNSPAGPDRSVFRLLVQPNGAIVAGGVFTTVNGLPIVALTRLLDGNVLRVSSQHVAASAEAWPIPAHDQLHLRLDAANRPQRVELLDALGRVVLTQAVSQAEMTLNTSPLTAGAYVLRVQYTTGPVSRRLVIE
ncbi:T9SS type A sorting domain-containing protein [Hymenobacter rubidus]|uniref:T9SS type A sorting domain-containing protein n=1 Tax=Hymenobacter rubidus TaxID=1441626 RepID=UPI00191F0CE1|nr:T9SS type A sorting domain-containing protein [Hymenobacter rubidus]